MKLVKLLWKTTTYGRIHTLEETLYSFINQDNLDSCEMIIVNDYPLQELIFDHPKVRIFNIKESFKTIGEKDNFCIEKSDADIICTCDDDDLYMPNHNTNIRTYFDYSKGILHWIGVYYNSPDITSIEFIGNSGMVYSREVWNKVGKHPIENAGGDSTFSDSVHKIYGYKIGDPLDTQVSAWYRWNLPQNGGIYHQSGNGKDVEGKPSIIQRHSEHIEKLRKKGLVPTGKIVLKPHWNKRYDLMLQEFINKNK